MLVLPFLTVRAISQGVMGPSEVPYGQHLAYGCPSINGKHCGTGDSTELGRCQEFIVVIRDLMLSHSGPQFPLNFRM
jgi:hypothetical protein